MLGQMLTDLRQVAAWIKSQPDSHYGYQPMVDDAFTAFSNDVNATEGEVDEHACFAAGLAAAQQVALTSTPDDLARYAIGAITWLLAMTDDESLTGALLLDCTQRQVRRMVAGKVEARRKDARLTYRPCCPWDRVRAEARRR
jgi:hypothetical protein